MAGGNVEKGVTAGATDPFSLRSLGSPIHIRDVHATILDLMGFPRFSSFTASPWAYNGKLFSLSEDGKTYVLKAGPEFEITETNDLDELSIASPAIAQGKLFIRTASKVYCITNQQEL